MKRNGSLSLPLVVAILAVGATGCSSNEKGYWSDETFRRQEAQQKQVATKETEPVTTRERAIVAEKPEPTRQVKQEQTAKIPIVEEQLQVGKREVPAGGKRVETEVTKKPVEKSVQLREERVEVEREQANRPATPQEARQAFQEQTIEMRERSEEPVVAKRPRVTEEITLRKEGEEHTETIREPIRKTEVEIMEAAEGIRYSRFEPEFRQHYQQQFAQSGKSFESYQPAYRYGFELAHDSAGQRDDWDAVEPEAKRAWEEQNPGTWNRFEPAIQHGWETAKRSRG